jgi:hypothetical protein
MEKVDNLSHNYTTVNKLPEQMVLPYLLDGINTSNISNKAKTTLSNGASNMTNNTSISHVQQANNTNGNNSSDIILNNLQQSFVNNFKQVGPFFFLFNVAICTLQFPRVVVTFDKKST